MPSVYPTPILPTSLPYRPRKNHCSSTKKQPIGRAAQVFVIGGGMCTPSAVLFYSVSSDISLVTQKQEESGKIFPVSDTSADVVNALVQAVRIKVAISTRKISNSYAGWWNYAHGFRCANHRRSTEIAHVGIQIGVHNRSQVPSLFSFVIRDPLITVLQGVSIPCVDVQLGPHDSKARKRERDSQVFSLQRRPLLVTHCGCSAPVVLALSSYGARYLHDCNYNASCQVNWVADLSEMEKEQLISDTRRWIPARLVSKTNIFRDCMPWRIWNALVAAAGTSVTSRWADVSKGSLRKLLELVHCTVFQIEGKGELKEEFVTADGIALSDECLKSFESKLVAGLFFAGEILDLMDEWADST